jgi:hypothetical protein
MRHAEPVRWIKIADDQITAVSDQSVHLSNRTQQIGTVDPMEDKIDDHQIEAFL